MNSMFMGVMLCVFALSQAQASDPTFPKDSVHKVESATEFKKITSGIGELKGQKIKLAGRMAGFDPADEGTIILAEWLPYPIDLDLEEGPKDPTQDSGLRFALRYPGEVHDPLFKWKGNKFILEGTIQGTRTVIMDMFGTEKMLLYVVAQCIHVWEQGETESMDQPDVQFKGPHLARTFCVNR